VNQDSIRPVREPADRSYTIYVCPECRRQSHPHDGTCSKDVRPGQFKPLQMYEVVPVEVVPVAKVERLREALERIANRRPAMSDAVEGRVRDPWPSGESEEARLRESLRQTNAIRDEALAENVRLRAERRELREALAFYDPHAPAAIEHEFGNA
jgi:hypothetical protein